MPGNHNDAFVAELKQRVVERNANLRHPFARKLIEGQLTPAQLRGWAAQRYKGITGMGMANLGQLFIKAPDEEVRGHIWEVLGEEGGYAHGEASHQEWLFRFGSALGMTRQDFEQLEPLPETVAVNSFYLHKLLNCSFLEGFVSVVAVESQNPTGFAAWSKAFQDHYGLERDALAFFLGHIEADSDEGGHAGEGWAIVARYAVTDELREAVSRTVDQALGMYWLSLDGIERAYVK